MKISLERKLRSDLGTLRDAILTSMSDGRSAALDHGLETYSSIFKAVMRELPTLPPGRQDLQFGLDYWRWLHRDIAEFAERATTSPLERAFSEVVDFVSGLCHLAYRNGQVGVIRSLFGVYVALWQQSSGDKHRREAWRDYLLISLNSLAEFSTRAEGDRELRWETRVAALGAAIEIVRCEMSDDQGNFEKAEDYLWHQFEYVDDEALSDLKAGGYLALVAWALLAKRETYTPHLLRRLSSQELASAYANAHEAYESRQFGWDHWESSLRMGTTVRAWAVQMGTLLDQAACMVALTQGPRSMEGFDTEPSSKLVGLLLRTVDIAALSMPGEVPPAWNAEQLRHALQRLSDGVQATEVAVIRDQPLDDGLIQNFVLRFASVLTGRDRFLPQVGTLDQQSPPAPDRWFGINTLVPKEYFTEGHDSFSPYELGTQLAQSLIQGETERVIATVSEAASLTRLQESSFVDWLLEFNLSADDGTQLLIVNSWKLWRHFGRNDRDASRHITVDIPETPTRAFIVDRAFREAVRYTTPEGLRLPGWQYHRSAAVAVRVTEADRPGTEEPAAHIQAFTSLWFETALLGQVQGFEVEGGDEH